MELTFIGYVLLVLGTAVVVAGKLKHAMMLMMASALLGGSAAVLLPALGESSIPPIQFVLVFVTLRILMPGSAAIRDLPDAFRANRWLALFALYGVATAFILPRMFAGTLSVYPMLFKIPDMQFASVPLRPTSQNITAAFYLTGTLLVAIAAWIGCRRQGVANSVVSALVIMCWTHTILGPAGVMLRETPANALFDLFRNSAYLQLDHDVGGFARIRGIFPEASSYAAFGFVLFVANAELWYHSIRSRATGLAALAMGLVLFFSTSSTAYVALAAYGLFFAVRFIALPGLASAAKGRAALAVSGMLVFAAAVAFILSPTLMESIGDVVRSMTIEKSTSYSGLQRLYWTRQGWELFLASGGLGVGPGSFRSSSMFVAILGSMGVIGVASFLIYLAAVFQPWRRSSWGWSPDPAENLGGALASAAVLSLIPAAVNSATAVPGVGFAIFAGASLALRPFAFARRLEAPDAPQCADVTAPAGVAPRSGQAASRGGG
jgi:hypothetical protein